VVTVSAAADEAAPRNRRG